MNTSRLKKLLNDVQSGALGVDKALEALRHLPFEDIEFAMVDHHRHLRQGAPEVTRARTYSRRARRARSTSRSRRSTGAQGTTRLHARS
jgi:NCAIR mutase (PurE)-related protein